jgi:hypothetical protein
MSYIDSDYEQHIRNIRGHIIDKCILLERLIDIYIATHFCGHWTQRTTELIELIIATNRMIWENKVQVFKILLERHKKAFLDTNPKLINIIIGIITHRNVFAHYMTMFGEESKDKFEKDKTITLVKFKNSVEYVTYTNDEIQKIYSDITDCIILLGEIVKPNDLE